MVLGARYGALAGAIGYVAMNLIVGGYVVYYSRQVLDSTLIDTSVGMHFVGALVVESVVVYVTVWGVLWAGGEPVVAAVAGALAACIGFGAPLWVVSAPARAVLRRTYELSTNRLPY
jgi:hypothetical protein